MKRVAVVRVRGLTGISPKAKHTLKLMCLTRVNHCSFIDDSKSSKGMLSVCKDYVTWGEPSEEVVKRMVAKRGLLPGNKRVSEEHIKAKGFSSLDDFVKKFYAFEATLGKAGLKPVFRLTPPRKGYRHTKKPFPAGALGYRAGKIDELLLRMI